MRVLHVITSLNRGGAEIHLLNLVSQQVKNGYKVRVVYWKENADLLKYFSRLNIKTYCLNNNKYFVENFLIFNLLFSIFRLGRQINIFDPNLLHAHLPFSEIICYFNILFRKKIKFVISKHIDTVFFSKDNRRKSNLGRIVEKIISKKAKKIICISQAVKKFMSSNYMKIEKKKLTKIYYGLDFNLYNSNIQSKKINFLKKKFKNRKVIGTISRLVPQKRLDIMINVFNDYNLNYEKKSYLLIVGRGPDKLELQSHAKKLKIDKNIIWLDYLDDIRGFFSLIDVFCLTSAHEGFGIVLLEAFFNKKPIICSKAGSIPEIIQNKKNGICLEKKNIKKYPKYFHIMMNKNKNKFIVDNAYKCLKKKFTNYEMFKKTDRIYKLI